MTETAPLVAQDYLFTVKPIPHKQLWVPISPSRPDHSAKLKPGMSMVPSDKAKVQSSSTSVAGDIGVRGRIKPWPASPQTSLTTALSCLPKKKITLS